MKKNRLLRTIRPSRLFIFFALAAMIALSLYPILQSDLLYCHDQTFHLTRIEAIKDGLLHHQFPVYIHETTLRGYGYGAGLFYPNFFLYIPALFRILGFSVMASYKLFLILVNIATCLSIYFCSKYICKSRYAALVASAFYMLAQYRLINIYTRGAAGEFLAMIFFPIVLCGIIDLLYCGFHRPWLLGLGFAGLMLTHSISLAAMLVITFVILLFHLPTLFKNKGYFLKLVVTAVCVLAVTSFFWLPMLEQFASGKFLVSTTENYLNASALSVTRLFDFYYKGIGFPLLFFPFLRLFLRRKPSNSRSLKIADGCFIAGIVLLGISTGLFPWGRLEETPFSLLQFPWRLLGFATLFLSIGCGIVCHQLFRRRERTIALILVLTVNAAFSIVTLNSRLGDLEVIPGNYFSSPERTLSIGMGEWLPVEADIDALNTPYTVFASGGTISLSESQKTGCTLSFSNEEQAESDYFDVPLLYYLGYRASIETEDGKTPLTVERSPNNNLVRVQNPQHLEGTITVRYGKTTVQVVSLITSGGTAAALIAYFLYRGQKMKKSGLPQ